MNIIKDSDVIQILENMLNTLDYRLVDHGKRVTYLCIRIMKQLQATEEDCLTVAKLALFHDIGAYKTDEVDAMLGFETVDVWEHAIYGYLFLSRMSPLKEYADCILYHHMPYHRLIHSDCHHKEITSLIHLCDRIDVAYSQNRSLEKTLNQPGMFYPDHVQAFQEINADHQIYAAITDGSYHEFIQNLFSSIHLNETQRNQYLEMLAYSIDFNSEFTVLHTIMTTSLTIELGKQFQLDKETMKKLYYGSLLHDVGKGAIPITILEKRGKLNDQEMELMKTHVLITEAILDGYVDPDILHMAARHHEKLDGSGYPYHLKADCLTLCDRIVAIADILSALLGKRSYKDEFPLPKVLSLIKKMAQDGKIDAQIVDVFCMNHQTILDHVKQNTAAMKELYETMQGEYLQLKKLLPSVS